MTEGGNVDIKSLMLQYLHGNMHSCVHTKKQIFRMITILHPCSAIGECEIIIFILHHILLARNILYVIFIALKYKITAGSTLILNTYPQSVFHYRLSTVSLISKHFDDKN